MKSGYPTRSSLDFSTFHFASSSTRKIINKRIEFSETDIKFEGKLIYNLAFGDINENGKIDDFAETNNGDIVRIIATVIASIYEYTSRFNHAIYFKGSNKQRTRFYQTILRRKRDLLIDDFEILGVTESNQCEEVEIFDPEVDYDGFLILRKLK